MATNLTKFTDSAGREAYKDSSGMVFTEGGNRATNYSEDDWNKRQTDKYGSVSANQIKAPVEVPYSSNAQSNYLSGLSKEEQKARNKVQDILSQQQVENDKRLAELRKNETVAVGEIKSLTTPFREDLEKTERERLHINKNFEENQKLVDELDTLLTEGNDLIKQQSEVTGLASIRNPRIQKTINDVAARVGVIEAVINARNGQIGQAYTMIDRSITAISADRKDQISYYETVINLNRQDMISLDENSSRIAQEQLDLAKGDLKRAEATVDYVKQLLVDPDTAGLMGEAGVRLTDSVDQINSKLRQAEYNREVRDMGNEVTLQGGVTVLNPSSVPADQLRSFTDSQGKTHYYKVPKASTATGGGKSATDYLDNLGSMNQSTNSSGGSTASQAPKFSPVGGVGSIWVDPKTGAIWQYISSGWKKIG